MTDNNRGNSTPPVSGSDQPNQSDTTVHTIDTTQYAPERTPKGYLRVATVPENPKPC